MRRFKRIIALLAACLMILQITASASLVLTKETSVDLWFRIFYSDQARLYPNDKSFEVNCIWPGSKKSVHDYGVINSLNAGAKSVQEVFGSESLNLLFNEGDSVYTTGLYLKDEGRTVTFYGMEEWNGFLFCTVGGPAPTYSTISHTAEDGSTTTVYDTHKRQDGFYTDGGQRVYYEGYYDYDSWLYIFDLSKETWYGDCRYAKWSIEDLGLQPSDVRRQILEDVTVDDDYIYLTINKNTADSKDSARSVAVFENNIDRDNPVYDEETGDIKVPERVDPTETYEGIATAAVEIIPHSRSKVHTAGSYTSTMINGYLVTFVANTDIPLSQSTDPQKESIIHVTDVRNVAEDGVGETKTHYLSPSFNKQSDCSNVFISQLLPLGGGKAWSSVINPYIRSIVVDGSTIYFLVTYTEKDADNNDVYHQKIFITDWTNPLRPSLLSQLDYVDKVVMYQKDNNVDVTITSNPAKLYYYDGYFYSTTGYGLSVIKKYNENNVLEPTLVKHYDYIEEKVKSGFTSTSSVIKSTLYGSIPTIVSIGNCIVMNYQDSQNFGTEVKIRFTEDKTEMAEVSKSNYASRMIPMAGIAQADIARYGSRLYIGAQGSNHFEIFPPRVHTYDFSRAFPVELSVDQINARVGAPYTITGGGMGINAVQIKVNGEDMGYVNVRKASGKYGTWSYTITEPGDYTFEAIGATLVGYPKEETSEIATFTVVATGELEYDAEITETTGDGGLRNVIISPQITSNTMSGYVNVMPVAAAYNGNTMITMEYGDTVRVEKDNTYIFDELKLVIPDNVGSYTVKTFLFDGKETLSAMADYVVKDF